ncbi:penicillin-binding protein 2 [Pelomonas sp. V22]|uniref:peptidoglycan D,D-transpeptidase FtsI family protein n=1 Tax=Pelomonas sp. V22 TaxID=2822139 RepID=UPI0024A9515C|nr:penicillin-binding protein 2 [Pelomonas sp. V22]MDI4635283.1 penicillin-binding protein 2 [Pelomonas sp. V22]
MLKRLRRRHSVHHSQSPLLAEPAPLWRSRLLVVVAGTAFAGLLGRALYVQGIGTEFFQQQGAARYSHKLELPASRGRISDRSGQLLATSVAVPSFWAIPADVDADPAKRAELARILGLTPAELAEKLLPGARFAWLRRQGDDAMAAQIKALGIKGVFQDREYQRRYPEGEAAAHVVGFTNLEEHGQEGMELALQAKLQGRDGSRAVVRDRLGHVVEDIGERVPPKDGQDVTLSIDSRIQYQAYERVREAVAAHQAKAGSAVVLDALTGEVLALANYPSFNPADRRHLSGEQLRNRALTDQFEPGSTMKPFTVALALEAGRVTPQTTFDVGGGKWNFFGSVITDAHPAGLLNVAEVIQKSSNIGAAKMGLQAQPRELYGMFSAIGLGQRPQLPFPGAAIGTLRPYAKWRPIEQATMSYGYGLSASLLQLAHAYTVFARDGELIPLSLDKQPEGKAVHGPRVFSAKTAQTMRTMLQTVTEAGGTSPQAQVAGYSVGGKSGTAYKQVGKGYDKTKYRAWFVGVAPISKPRIVVAVMVDEPTRGAHDGGKVAGPVFSELTGRSLRLLKVQPDLAVKPQIVAGLTPAADRKEQL